MPQTLHIYFIRMKSRIVQGEHFRDARKLDEANKPKRAACGLWCFRAPQHRSPPFFWKWRNS